MSVDIIGSYAPKTATYIVQTTNATLDNAQSLDTLATGLLKNTTGTGVLSAAAEGTDYYGPAGTDVAVADGGTGASTAGDARTNLGLVIGTNVQAYDADLTTWAGITPGANVGAFLATPSSANLLAAVTDETGTGALVFADTPTLVTPDIGAATGTSLSLGGVAVPTLTSTSTLTNKRITKRVVTTTSNATATIDSDVTDVYELTDMDADTTFTITGTPTDGQTFVVRVKDDGTTRALTWTGFTQIGVTLPATSTVSKWHYVGVTYNSGSAAWHAIALSTEV